MLFRSRASRQQTIRSPRKTIKKIPLTRRRTRRHRHRLRNIAQKNTPLQKQRRILLRRPKAPGQAQRRRGRLLLQYAPILALPLGALRALLRRLLAAQYDPLKQKHMVLAVDIGLGDHKDVVEEELAKVLEVVALPVVDARLEGLDGLLVLRAPLGFVDLVRDALRRFGPPLELVVVRVRRRRTRFDKRLETNKAREQDSNPSISTCQFFSSTPE